MVDSTARHTMLSCGLSTRPTMHMEQRGSDNPSVMESLRAQVSALFRGPRVKSVPLSTCVLLCVFCCWAGSWLGSGLVADVPVPSSDIKRMSNTATADGSGGLGSVAGGGRSLLLLQKEAQRALRAEQQVRQQQKQGSAIEVHQQAALLGIGSPADISRFETIALRQSGYEVVRPPLQPAASGEPAMRAIPFQVISWYPRMTYYPGFIAQEDAEHILALAKRHMSPSSLAYKPGESIPESQQVRTSTGCFLSTGADPAGVLTALENKIAAVTHLPVENGEAFNVLRYQLGQHYDSHQDTFDEKDFGKQPSHRVATFLCYLHSPEEGGETVFKREGRDGGNRPITDWQTCTDGLGVRVKPKQGDCVLFWSLTPDLVQDPRALHGACAVLKGEKWSIAKWLHEKPVYELRGGVRPRQ